MREILNENRMKIIGTGSAFPKHTVTNDMLSEILDTSDAWIFPRTGIKSRQVISDEKLEDIAVEAALKALTEAGIKAEDLDYIVCSNVVNEYVTPALSCIIQGIIGASCPCIDINAACAGLPFALDIVESMYQAGRVKNVLVVCAEEPSRMPDWTNRNLSVLFGDGAGALVLTEGDNIKGIKLSTASATEKLYQKRILEPTPYITKEEEHVPLQMNGQEVFKFAVSSSVKDIKYMLEELNLEADKIDHYVLHQANLRIINSIRNMFGLEESKFPVNIEKYGNTSSASSAILLDECNKKGVFKKGDLIAISAFGAGFVSGAVILEW